MALAADSIYGCQASAPGTSATIPVQSAAGHRGDAGPAGAELAGRRAFTRLVQRDAQALRTRASPGRAGVVTEEMLSDLPEPVRRYLRYTGVVGRPFPGTVRLHQKGTMRVGPGQRWLPLDAEEHYSVRPPGFVWAGTVRVGPLVVGRARDSTGPAKPPRRMSPCSAPRPGPAPWRPRSPPRSASSPRRPAHGTCPRCAPRWPGGRRPAGSPPTRPPGGRGRRSR